MRIAFVVPRYGQEIVGGAEYYARMLALHLKKYHQIEILTTCAKDYITWRNEYDSGPALIDDILVIRFKTNKERCLNMQMNLEERVFYNTHSILDEIKWIDEQGPFCVDMINYIKNNASTYDCFVFFTYRYYLSYHGIKLVGDRSLLVPFAENDPALNLKTTCDTFRKASGIAYMVPEERVLIKKKLDLIEDDKAWDLVGYGIDITKIDNSENPMNEDYILYLGRIDGSKGCYKLFEFYLRAVEEFSNIPKLVLAGTDVIEIPKHDNINYIGFVSEHYKLLLLRGAKCLVMPSPYESLSIVTLEAMGSGTPVLVNGDCQVLKGHCLRSNAGLWYQNYEEFRECIKLLVSDDLLRNKMGENGKKYVEKNYSWPKVEEKYLRLLNMLNTA